jgi:O-antigen/teichoic acid export membrane protein
MLVLLIGTTIVVRCVAYFGARYGEDGFRACLLACGVFAAALLPLTWTITWAALGIDGKPSYTASNIYALTVPLSMISAMLAAALLVERRLGWFWLNEAVTAGGTALAVFGLAWAGVLSATSFAISAVAAVVVAIIAVAFVQRSFRRPMLNLRHASLVESVIGYGARVGATLVPFHLATRLDQLVVSVSAPLATLGNYVVAAAWASVLGMVGSGFATVVLSDSARIDLNNRADVERAAGRLRRAGVVVALVGMLTCLTAPIGIPLLYGSDFSAAIVPAIVLSIASIPLHSNAILHEFSRGAGIPSVGWLPETAGVAAGLLALKLLYFRFGMVGAAFASLISFSVVSALLFYRLSREIELLRLRALIPRLSDLRVIWNSARLWAIPRRDGPASALP